MGILSPHLRIFWLQCLQRHLKIDAFGGRRFGNWWLIHGSIVGMCVCGVSLIHRDTALEFGGDGCGN